MENLTKGKHLWLRNIFSTTGSQLIDTVSILLILFYSSNLGENVNQLSDLIPLIYSSYLFKFFFALFDTPLFYLGVWFFKPKIENE